MLAGTTQRFRYSEPKLGLRCVYILKDQYVIIQAIYRHSVAAQAILMCSRG